ncbi:MAG TPA: alkaline phosphatase family protein [Verrucomicrobiota bacterium]|nr:alkaline phosphatase family protein [Verrucomicrobiota bacterium]HNU51877.1 alkaline phosphatase family protein [Verrucomicrobiota bacterium]
MNALLRFPARAAGFGLAFLAAVAFAPAGARAAAITLPAPVHFEDFDATPEGALPEGWTQTTYSAVPDPRLNLQYLNSASYARWIVVSRDRFTNAFLSYNSHTPTTDYQRVLSSNPANVVNGQVVSDLARGRFAFGNSGYRSGGSQVLYLFSPDYDLTGRTNVHLAFHSMWEQNQDSLGAVEYSVDGGATWLPVVYLIDGPRVLRSGDGAVDALRTLTNRYSDVATYLDPVSGLTRGGTYGAFVGVASNQWAALAPFISPRVDDNRVESKRVEFHRLPLADDQPRVRLRFAHAGTDSWYFGVDDVGLYSIGTGAPPLVVESTGDLRLSLGTTATFSVAATGDPPLTYQWRCNGTNMPGATNAMLTVPATQTGRQGVYAVHVMNAVGSALTAGAALEVYAPRVTGQWDFNGGDLRATVGADLEYRGDAASRTTFEAMPIAGSPARVMAFGTHGVEAGYRMRHGARPNGGGRFVNQYTLVLDLMFPSSSTDRWRALVQTDPFNHRDNDADLCIGDAFTLPDPNGVGAEGAYHGPIAPDAWHRVALAVDLTAPPAQRLTKCVNGLRVGTQPLAEGVDGRHSLGPAVLLFTTGRGAGEGTQPGFVNSIQFVDGWLPESALLEFGTAAASGLPSGDALPRLASFSFGEGGLSFTWEGGEPPFQVEHAAGLSSAAWTESGGPTTNRMAVVQPAGATLFYRVRQFTPAPRTGEAFDGATAVATAQLVRPAGDSLEFGGRPVDLAVAPDGQFVYAKDNRGIVAVDAAFWSVIQELSFPSGGGGSLHGVMVRADGQRLYATDSQSGLWEGAIAADGTVSWLRSIMLPGNGASYPCGIALNEAGTRAYVCLSRNNTLAVVDLATGSVSRQIPVGLAPFDVVLSADGTTAYVSDWGGRRPGAGDRTAPSAGSAVVVEERGVGSSGAVSVVDLMAGAQTHLILTGLHPSDLVLSADGSRLYVANANSDTVTVIDTASKSVAETISVRPDAALPFGSAANALALSPDERRLYVANGGNNAIAVVALPGGSRNRSVVEGYIPAGWYPSGVVARGDRLLVCNAKGLGSRNRLQAGTSWSVYWYLGTLNRVGVPDPETLSKLTAQVYEDARVPQMLRERDASISDVPPVPVPARWGEPSVFRHVIYVVKENRTYDQLFGDLPQGNGDPALCVFGRAVTPNHHALAEQFVLLDNFYCNGVNSSDGHNWVTEGNSTDYMEKSFGGFTRSAPWGDDALNYSSTGFIWNNVLEHGLSFRNYGEFDYAESVPSSATWTGIYRDFVSGTRSIRYVQNIGIESLRPYSSTNVPGWNMKIPDVVRADGFLRELQEAEATGFLPHFVFLYLPEDHTTGSSPGYPTPRAQVADNDLALGRVAEAVSRSRFWTNTCIFVIEDDPQAGFDHVDGHRSICLVISPYTKRGRVVSEFYNQTAVLHTMERILGLPAMTQLDAGAPLMTACFTPVADFTPYSCLSNNIPLDEMNPGTASLPPRERHFADLSLKQDFAHVDAANEDELNRILWHSVKGVDAPYPAEWAGAHGRGLKALGLALAPDEQDGDD